MAISIDDIDVIIRGIIGVSLTELETNRVLNLPTPNDFSIANNVTQQRIAGFNSSGYMVQGVAFAKGYDYTMNMRYSQMQPELLSLRLGSKFKQFSNKDMTITRAIDVYTTQMPALGGSAGRYGFNIPEDADGNASVTVNGISVVLEQEAYDGFVFTESQKFAIGAAGALKFSNDLLNRRVTMTLPYRVSAGKEWSNESIGKYRLDASLVTVADEVVLLHVPSVTPNLEGGGFTPMADGIEIPFFLTSLQGRKTPYDIVYTGERL
jgi:hypothetical protein